MHEQIRKQVFDRFCAFGIEAQFPANWFSIRFSLEDLEERVCIDWATVLLAVSSGYLEESSIFSYAIQEYDGAEEGVTFRLALMSYEDDRDLFEVDRLLGKLVAETTRAGWEGALRRLFYVAVSWVYENWSELDDPVRTLFDVWDDFGAPESGRMLSKYHFRAPVFSNISTEDYFRKQCEIFLKNAAESL